MKKEVFISYSRKDINIARKIKQQIESKTSVSCWMDMEGIESGSQFQDVIISAINESNIVLLLLSQNSMQSPWVKKEINYAHEKKKKVVPINIDGSQPGDWFLFTFSGNDVIDFNNKDQQRKFFDNIVGWCSREPGAIPTPPSPITRTGFNSFINKAIWAQYVIWGVLCLISVWITFNTAGALCIGRSIFPVVLDILLSGTLIATYYLSKEKKLAFYAICLLDFIEIFIVCKMGYSAYIKSPEGGYGTDIYINLWGLGAYIARKSFIFTYIILSSAAIIHIAIMITLLKLKNNHGMSGWDLLK